MKIFIILNLILLSTAQSVEEFKKCRIDDDDCMLKSASFMIKNYPKGKTCIK